MRLKQLIINNFRLFQTASLEFAADTPCNILVGPNNSGKTSVMEAIRLVAGSASSDRNRIKIHDFPLAIRCKFKTAQDALEEANQEDNEARTQALLVNLPRMRFDLVFAYDDTPADLTLIRPLLMDLSPDISDIRVRLEFSLSNPLELANNYRDRRRPETQTLYEVLAENLYAYYGKRFYKVAADGSDAEPLEDGSAVQRLIRVDWISAQRYVDDEESSKAAKLSRLLHAHYENYVRKTDKTEFDALEDAIGESAAELTERYERAFERLLRRLKSFGYPQGATTPDLRIRAELDSRTIYQDNTRIFYCAPTEDEAPPELPERYNGLGYKNLIFMVLQLETFRAALEANLDSLPGVHLICIEEPEAHLHPQMQSVFIAEIQKVLKEAEGPTGQVLVSTHSSHVVADSGFTPVRYFRRAKDRVDIRDLSLLPGIIQTRTVANEEAAAGILQFLRRYVKLGHCDLFFADKAILVEGQVEKLLMPAMIEVVAKEEGYEALARQYVTILEIGGDYAHKLAPLLNFIGIPTLVVTDIDSAQSDRTKCPVADGEISTNPAIRYWLPQKATLEDLIKAQAHEKISGALRLAYQTEEDGCIGRSFEEAFVYANKGWLTENVGKLAATGTALQNAVNSGIAAAAYDFGANVRKVDLALDLMSVEGWVAPAYIAEGLKWLAKEPLE